MYEIHISDIRSFKQCRRKWNWSSPLRMNLEKAVTYAPFFTGKAVHYGLQQYYEQGTHPTVAATDFMQGEFKRLEDQFGPAWEAEAEVLQDQVSLVTGVLDHYVLWAQSEKGVHSDSNLEFLALETEFNVPLQSGKGKRASSKLRLGGRFDGVVKRITDGTYWIWETKTTRSITELSDTLGNDEQCGAYILAAQKMLGIPISGVIYNVLRKKVPTSPAVLQNGYLSQRADLDSTGEAFVAAAKAHHAEWSFDEILGYYGNYIETLLAKGNKFFDRIAVYRTPHELEQLEKDLVATGLEMTRKTTPLYPSPSWINCRFCSFRRPCLVMNGGGDLDFVFEHEYRPRQEWDPITAKEEGNETN